jgi:site-specific DNA-methyltransferase (adenine-specific)
LLDLNNTVYHGDCLQIMDGIPDKSINLILCDLPYQMVDASWDQLIPFDKLWAQYERIITDNGAIVLTASQPFTSALVMSNPKLFRYEWIWEKNVASNFQNAKKNPLKIHESVLVFYKKLPTYNPQGIIKLDKPRIKSNRGKTTADGKLKEGKLNHLRGATKRDSYVTEFTNYPKSILRFDVERGLHPTQKPVKLFEYLIKIYSNEGEVVLDNCAGCGTTGVAAMNTGRRFVLIEKDATYFNACVSRLRQ